MGAAVQAVPGQESYGLVRPFLRRSAGSAESSDWKVHHVSVALARDQLPSPRCRRHHQSPDGVGAVYRLGKGCPRAVPHRYVEELGAAPAAPEIGAAGDGLSEPTTFRARAHKL